MKKTQYDDQLEQIKKYENWLTNGQSSEYFKRAYAIAVKRGRYPGISERVKMLSNIIKELDEKLSRRSLERYKAFIFGWNRA